MCDRQKKISLEDKRSLCESSGGKWLWNKYEIGVLCAVKKESRFIVFWGKEADAQKPFSCLNFRYETTMPKHPKQPLNGESEYSVVGTTSAAIYLKLGWHYRTLLTFGSLNRSLRGIMKCETSLYWLEQSSPWKTVFCFRLIGLLFLSEGVRTDSHLQWYPHSCFDYTELPPLINSKQSP